MLATILDTIILLTPAVNNSVVVAENHVLRVFNHDILLLPKTWAPSSLDIALQIILNYDIYSYFSRSSLNTGFLLRLVKLQKIKICDSMKLSASYDAVTHLELDNSETDILAC